MQIAFIGLGNMGAPMAINLAKAGHSVKAFDLSQEAIAKVVAAGARRLQCPGRRAGRRSRHHHAARQPACGSLFLGRGDAACCAHRQGHAGHRQLHHRRGHQPEGGQGR
jgi:3-hydroxyisobutyrate dehydrogenase